MQMVAVDILGPLPRTSAGNRYVLVAGDYFTKWIEAYPIPNQEAVTVAQKLLDEMFCRFSLPERLHSDQGRQFEADIIKQLCQLLQFEKTRTTPYHPQSDGFIERFNRTLLNMLSTCLDHHNSDWDMYVSKVCMAYNSSVQSTTGYSPFYLMFGRDARLPTDIIHEPPQCIADIPTQQLYGQYVVNQQEKFLKAFEAVRKSISTKQCHQKQLYNQKVHGDPYRPGDLVWLYNPAVAKGKSRKLHRPWKGPYQVHAKLSDVNYRIQHTGNNKFTVVHFDRLKHCPPNIRLPGKVHPPAPEKRSVDLTPPGTSLELVENEDGLDPQDGDDTADPPAPANPPC